MKTLAYMSVYVMEIEYSSRLLLKVMLFFFAFFGEDEGKHITFLGGYNTVDRIMEGETPIIQYTLVIQYM